MFPPSYRPPSVSFVISVPLIYTRSPPPFLARNVVQLDVAHTHPPPASAARSAPCAAYLRLPSNPASFTPPFRPCSSPRSLSAPRGLQAASPSAPLFSVSLPVCCSVYRHLLGLGSSGCPFHATVKDVTKVNLFIGIGTTVNKCFGINGVACYFLCVLYHIKQTCDCLLYLQNCHQIHVGHLVVYIFKVEMVFWTTIV